MYVMQLPCLSLFLMYNFLHDAQADCLPEPRDVFTFLKVHIVLVMSVACNIHSIFVLASQENSIGQDFALYYLAYAAYMELRGNFPRADAIFQSGVERYCMSSWQLCAKPLTKSLRQTCDPGNTVQAGTPDRQTEDKI